MTASKSSSYRQATATIRVLTAANVGVATSVTLRWTVVRTGTTTVTTLSTPTVNLAAAGTAILSPRTTYAGTFTVTVTNVVAPAGLAWDRVATKRSATAP
jgi:hypothetical protein